MHPIIIFLLSFLSNLFYAIYVKQVAKDKVLEAAFFGELVVICGALMVINYVEEHLLLIPIIAGGFLGTLLNKKICRLLNIT